MRYDMWTPSRLGKGKRDAVIGRNMPYQFEGIETEWSQKKYSQRIVYDFFTKQFH